MNTAVLVSSPRVATRKPMTVAMLLAMIVVGLGTGSTAGWLAVVPSIARVDVAEIEPANTEAQLKLATFLLLGQKYPDARKRVDDILAREPNNVEALLLLANASFYELTMWPVIGNFQFAAALLQRAEATGLLPGGDALRRRKRVLLVAPADARLVAYRHQQLARAEDGAGRGKGNALLLHRARHPFHQADRQGGRERHHRRAERVPPAGHAADHFRRPGTLEDLRAAVRLALRHGDRP